MCACTLSHVRVCRRPRCRWPRACAKRRVLYNKNVSRYLCARGWRNRLAVTMFGTVISTRPRCALVGPAASDTSFYRIHARSQPGVAPAFTKSDHESHVAVGALLCIAAQLAHEQPPGFTCRCERGRICNIWLLCGNKLPSRWKTLWAPHVCVCVCVSLGLSVRSLSDCG